MSVRFYAVVIDSTDHRALGHWWSEALGLPVVFEDDDEVVVAAGPDAEPGLVFVPVPEAKSVKNRLHIDLGPDDQVVEVERLVALGARRVDVGQVDADVTWVVLADPEGNEFCVLSAR